MIPLTEAELDDLVRDPGAYAAWSEIPRLVEELRALRVVAREAEALKCTTPEVTPDGNVPCWQCVPCKVHRALAALEATP